MWRHRDILIKGWPYSKGHRLSLVGMGITTVLMALLPLIQPWPFAFLIDSVVGEQAYPGPLSWLDDSDPVSQILFSIGLMLAIELLAHAVGILAQWLEVRFELNVVRDFRSALFRHTQQLSLAYLDQQRAGQFIYYINFQAHSLGSLITTTLPLIQMLITVVGALIITWLISPTLALIAMATIPFIVLSTTLYNKYVEPTLIRVRNLEGGSMGIVHESIAMMRVVVAFCREELEYRVFRNNADRSVSARVHLTMRQAFFVALVNMISAFGTAAAVGYSAYLIMNGNTSVGSLIVIMSYMTRVYQPLEQLSTTIASVQEQFVNIRISFDLLEIPIDIVEKPGAAALPPVLGEVRFEDVSFQYPNTTRPAVEQVSFQVMPGEKVAIVGPTGAGKSTLMSMIPRFADPSSGRVLIDGWDLKDLTLHSIRSQVSVVSQEPLLFGRTVEENIRYGNILATHEEVVAAARAANAHDFIEALPHGYETKLAERGSGLSGGERQRLTIARAFLKDAPILILDEPTSSIDSKTEAGILDALDRLVAGRTTFVVAHRLSTVADADHILVIGGSHIVQHGTHEELLAQEGLYREMWTAQTGVRTGRSVSLPPAPPPYRGPSMPAAHALSAAIAAAEAAEAERFEAEAMEDVADLTQEDAAFASMHPENGDRVTADVDGNVRVIHGNGHHPGDGHHAGNGHDRGNGQHAGNGHQAGNGSPRPAPPSDTESTPTGGATDPAQALFDSGALRALLEREE